MARRALVVITGAVLMLVSLVAPRAEGQEPPAVPDPAATDPGATSATTVPTTATSEGPAAPSASTVTSGPPAPVDVHADPLDGGASLHWTAPGADPPIVGFVVRRDGGVVARLDADAGAFTEHGLLAEVAVTYTVASLDETGEGPESEPVVVVPTADTSPGFSTAESGGTEGTERRVFTFSIATRGAIRSNVDHFSMHVAHTLNDPRGWALGGSIEFRQVSSGGDFTVWLAEASTVPSFSSVCSAQWSCRVGRNVVINEMRWRSATPSWLAGGGSLDSYQHYVVIHETGHWLGFGHSNCPGAGQLAPVMQQQSKGLQGCRHNGWPIPGERAGVASRTGAPARPVGPESDATVWGQVGDQVLACDWNGDGVDTQGVYRNGTWYVRNSLTGGEARSFVWGKPGDVAVCGDWNGDGIDGIGRVRGSRWFLRNSASAGPFLTFRFGGPEARPVAGDWDGRGGDGIGRARNGKWKLRNTPGAGPVQWRLAYGRAGDQYVPGDWDGDGIDEPGVVRGASWYLLSSWWPGSGGMVVRYGAGDAVSGRWDGLAVDKPGRFLNRLFAFRRYSPTP